MSNKNTFVRWVDKDRLPGAWIDADGNRHIDVFAIHEANGWPNTSEEVEDTIRILNHLLKDMLPRAKGEFIDAIVVELEKVPPTAQ